MISQIFVAPDSFEKTNDFISINSLLNDIYNSPVFIIDFEKVNWVKYIRKHYLDHYDTKFKDILTQKLIKVDKSKKIFKRNNYDVEIMSDDDWLNVAYLSEKEKSYNLIVSGNQRIDTYREKFVDNIENINDIVISSDKWDTVKMTDTEVKKKPSDYKRAFGDILRNSKKLKIVDVYIGSSFQHDRKQFRNDDKQIIELFSELLASNKTGNGIIEIHTMLDKELETSYVLPREELENKIQEMYNGDEKYNRKRENWLRVIQTYANKYKHTYKIYFWSNRNKKSTFHDRYIFTDLIGVSPNHSISATEDSDQDTLWKVLNRTEREKQEPKYDFDDPYFIPSCEPLEVEPNE